MKKKWLLVSKTTLEIGKFSPENWKVSKLGLSWDPFVQSRKFVSLEFTEELCVMILKNDTKFEEELTCHFKIVWVVWRILTRAFKNLKNLLFNWLLWRKHIMIELKNYRTVMFDGIEDLCKIWGKTVLCMLSKMTWGIWQICIGWNNG